MKVRRLFQVALLAVIPFGMAVSSAGAVEGDTVVLQGLDKVTARVWTFDAPVGQDLATYLNLPDTIFDLDLTPNRGDCFSVLGVARDVAALTGSTLKAPQFESVAADTLGMRMPEPSLKKSFGCCGFKRG